MKKQIFQIILFSLIPVYGLNAQEKQHDQFNNRFQNVEELAISSENCILENRHLWVSSEIQTVNPDFSGIGGITSIYSPPFNLSPFQMELRFFDKKIVPIKYTWKPGEIILDAESDGIRIKCLLVPAFSSNRIIEVFELSNLKSEKIIVPVMISANPGLSYFDNLWPWSPQKADKMAILKKTEKKGGLCFESADGIIEIGSQNQELTRSENELTGQIQLKPGGKKYFTLVVSYTGKKEINKSTDLKVDGDELINQSRERWNERLEYAYSHLGRIKSSNPEFDLFYKRGILSLLTCEWNKQEMIFSPYFSESGIDGGAVCSYLWGIAYVSRIMPLYNPGAWKEQIKQSIKTDAKNHYAFTPFTGESIGPWYSYNQYSAIRIIYDYVIVTGDYGFLTETIDNKRIIDYCIEQASYKDDLKQNAKLINYGTNENLLELRKTGTYQFVVPSPNAERCWSYRAVDDLCKLADSRNLNLSQRADDIADLINKELWSEEKKWFLTIDTLGNRHFSPSIQIFDMLRCGVFSKEQEIKIISHLNETEFLSRYGVHSLSKKDPGYDINDADWGGPGVYAGDAPELIEDLYYSGYPEKAEDVLKSILWWGKHFPYYPQAIIADKIDYRHNGRANVLAGLASTQSVLFGVLGLKFLPTGEISINIPDNDLFDTLNIDGLLIKDRNTSIKIIDDDIFVAPEGKNVIKGRIGQMFYF